MHATDYADARGEALLSASEEFLGGARALAQDVVATHNHEGYQDLGHHVEDRVGADLQVCEWERHSKIESERLLQIGIDTQRHM